MDEPIFTDEPISEPSGVESSAAAGQTEPTEPNNDPSGVEPSADAGQKVEEAFAARLAAATEKVRREAEQAAEAKIRGQYDSTIAKLGMEWNGKAITTQTELDEALAQKAMQDEAARNKVSPDVYARLIKAEQASRDAQSQLMQHRQKEIMAQESDKLSKDETWGNFYKENEQQIRELAGEANSNLYTAMILAYSQKGPADVEALKNDAVKEYLEKKRTYKPIEGGGAAPVSVQQTPKTFGEARKQALEYLNHIE